MVDALNEQWKYYILNHLYCFRNVCAVAGQIVGVIVLDERVNQESANLLTVGSSSGSSARSMAEVEGVPSGAIIAQVILVRLTLAWLTGIILLIATILGVIKITLLLFYQ